MGRVSWRPTYSRRIFGRFLGWTPDGLAKVKRGSRIDYLDPSELTWEG
jgi:hypothetical protein